MYPFREGNDRTGRIWLNLALEKLINKHIDFTDISTKVYLNHMRNDDSKKLCALFEKALVNLDEKTYKELWIHNAEASYKYEGYHIDNTKVKIVESDDKKITYEEYLEERCKTK